MPDYRSWGRQGQESFLALQTDAWVMPEQVPLLGWLDAFPQMADVRAAIEADPVLSTRVDRGVGVEFSRQRRPLDWLLIQHLLEPMVRETRLYRLDERAFDVAYHRLEAGLLAEQVRLVEFVPLNAFVPSSDVPAVELPGGSVLRAMTDSQISAAIGYHAVPEEFAGGTNSVTVARIHQWALQVERSYPICSDAAAGGPQPTAPHFPSLGVAAETLVAALRLVCGGSVVATRPLQAQHDDDFPLIPGAGAVLSAVPAADYGRPTLLGADAVAATRRTYRLLNLPAIREDRNLQTALRRLVIAGSEARPADRLIDLMVCAEILLLKRAGYTGPSKGAEIARAATALLTDAPDPQVEPDQVAALLRTAYRLRNAEMHGDEPTALSLQRLHGSRPAGLPAVVDNVEVVLRSVTLRIVADLTDGVST